MSASAARARRAVRSTCGGVAAAGLVGVLTPLWWADRARAALRTRRTRPARVAVPVVEIDHLDDLTDIVDGPSPVIVSGFVDRLDLEHPADLDGLRRIADHTDSAFPVARHRDDAPYFLYVGDYGSEKVATERLTLHEFLDDLFGPDTAERDPDRTTYQLFSVDRLDGQVGHVVDRMAERLGPATGRRPDRSASGSWVGSRGCVTPLHHDAWTGLLVQTHGSKRVALYHPDDRRNVYFSSPFRPTSRWSELPARSSEADPDRFPRLRRATRWETVLDAGQALFIPPYWSHEVEALDANISIPFRFRPRARDHLDPGFLRPAVEILHRKVAA